MWNSFCDFCAFLWLTFGLTDRGDGPFRLRQVPLGCAQVMLGHPQFLNLHTPLRTDKISGDIV
jgi:hypothetical protein